MQNQLPWIGYPTVEALAENIDPSRVMYVNGTTETHAHTDGSGMSTRLYGVRVTSLTPEAIHYVEIRTGRCLMHASGPFEQKDADAAFQRTKDAENVIGEWLRAKGFRVVKATVAEPTAIKLLNGGADFMDYNKETDRISLKA